MIEDIWNELNEEEIHARDSLQFELKSEFFIHPHLKKNIYKQEIYLFIPNVLQINDENYSKQQFYRDRTNIIRYKTPFISLADLMNWKNEQSPLTRLQNFLNRQTPSLSLVNAVDELKLFGAVFRASLRESIYRIIKEIRDKEQEAEVSSSVTHLYSLVSQISYEFRKLEKKAGYFNDNNSLIRYFRYIDEFMSLVIEELFTFLLKQYRELKKEKNSIEDLICELIFKEQDYRRKKNMRPKAVFPLFFSESILYRQSLLNRFVLEALMLKNYRFSLEEKHRHILGAIAAGIAMMVYMSLFIWKSPDYVFSSFAFVILAVILYVLKDRIKEEFKNFYFKQAPRWFPDYSTEIENFKGFKIGKLRENFSFIKPDQLSEGFWKIRNSHFHEQLQALQRQETIIQYKREIILNQPLKNKKHRRKELTVIFRLNVHRFLQKASNAFQMTLSIDSHDRKIKQNLLPKVYHLNLIIRNFSLKDDSMPKIDIKTYRVVVDKNGIKRIENLSKLL